MKSIVAHRIIVLGCFGNYPSVQYHDHAMKKPVMIAQWFHLFEQLHSNATGGKHHTELYPYLAYPAVAIHPLFAGSIHQVIAYPKDMYSVSGHGVMVAGRVAHHHHHHSTCTSRIR